MIPAARDEKFLTARTVFARAIAALVREMMEGAYPLSVPLRADAHIVLNWGEAK